MSGRSVANERKKEKRKPKRYLFTFSPECITAIVIVESIKLTLTKQTHKRKDQGSSTKINHAIS